MLIDPYAKAVEGPWHLNEALFPYHFGQPEGSRNDLDSGPYIPKCVVINPFFDWNSDARPNTPWHRTVVYETHVKGFTERHPGIPEELRGTYAGLAHPTAVRYLQRLGITAIELLPVHQFVQDASLDTVTSQGKQSEPVARLSALPENTMTVSTGAVVVSDAGLRVTTETTETRVSTDSVTELVVTTQPAGARVTVNGIGWGSSPVTVRHLPPGDQRIRMSKEGYATEERVLRLAEGRRRTLDIRLQSAP